MGAIVEPSVNIYVVPVGGIPVVWPEAEPLLTDLLEMHGGYESEDIYNALMKTQMQLWVVFKPEGLCAVVVTEVLDFPKKKTLFVLFASGRQLKEWKRINEEIEQWGKNIGCAEVMAWGRRGWAKYYPEHKQNLVIFRKEI